VILEMLKKKNLNIESVIINLSNKKISAKLITKRLKPLLGKTLLPSIKVILNTI
jgi:hypothetical protein